MRVRRIAGTLATTHTALLAARDLLHHFFLRYAILVIGTTVGTQGISYYSFEDKSRKPASFRNIDSAGSQQLYLPLFTITIRPAVRSQAARQPMCSQRIPSAESPYQERTPQ